MTHILEKGGVKNLRSGRIIHEAGEAEA